MRNIIRQLQFGKYKKIYGVSEIHPVIESEIAQVVRNDSVFNAVQFPIFLYFKYGRECWLGRI